MNKHTPTPWRTVANLVQGARKPNGDSRTVAMVGSGAEDEANADFIVRACNSHADLLAALELAMLFAEKEATHLAIDCHMGASEWESFMPTWTTDARAAIAKAKGGADA